MKSTAAVFMIFTLSFTLSGIAAEREHTITVAGKAEERVTPDVAYVTLYAQADGILMVDAVKKADKLIDEITVAIKTQTNVVRDLSIADIALGEKKRQYWGPDQQEEAPRPQVARRIRVLCKPVAEEIYEVIDQAIRAGALMQIPSTTSYSDDIRSVVIYGLEHSAEVVERVKESAMNDARMEAKKLANLAGKTVGNLVTMGCSEALHYSFPARVMGRQVDYPTEYISMNAEELTISHTVSVTFELKD